MQLLVSASNFVGCLAEVIAIVTWLDIDQWQGTRFCLLGLVATI